MDIKAILRDKLIARYGEKNVGDFHVMGSSITYLGVYFDELIITESRSNLTHNIKGICFGFDFSNNFIKVVCARHIYTIGELRDCYVHSHASPLYNEECYYRDFCLGTSPYRVIAQNIQTLLEGEETVQLGEGETLESVIEDNIESLVVAFDQMVRVESYEGGPYLTIKRLNSINTSNSTYLNCNYTSPLNLRYLSDSHSEFEIIREAPEESLIDAIAFLSYCLTHESFKQIYEEDCNLYGYGEFGPECRNIQYPSSSKRSWVHPIIFNDEVKDAVIIEEEESTIGDNWIKCSIGTDSLMSLYKKALFFKKIKQQNEHRL